MKTEKRKLGDFGETAAAKYLKKKHYKIIARNFVSGKNELDIIAENKEYIVFAEVKTRTAHSPEESEYGRPADAVNYYKQKHTVACARDFLHQYYTEKQPRMDIIEVYTERTLWGKYRVVQIIHMEDAYGG